MRDLMQVYRAVVDSVPMGTTQTDVYRMVVEHPAPRFYVDPRRVHCVLSPMMRGDRRMLDRMGCLKRQMYLDLYDKVMELSQRKGFWGKSLNFKLREAVLEPAPRFYISPTRMGQVWQEMTAEARQQRYKRMTKDYGKRND